MQTSKWLSVCLVVAAAVALSAQTGRTFKGRLSTVARDLSMVTVSGAGSLSATLSGAKLTVTGTFEGLQSPATIAQLHRSPVTGVRGPIIGDLTVGHDTSGTLSGTVDLTPAQVTDLQKGRLYVQVHSEKAPDGNLWGWLLPQESRRPAQENRQ